MEIPHQEESYGWIELEYKNKMDFKEELQQINAGGNIILQHGTQVIIGSVMLVRRLLNLKLLEKDSLKVVYGISADDNRTKALNASLTEQGLKIIGWDTKYSKEQLEDLQTFLPEYYRE